jgi:NAD(P)-dependent dehydrogenase (short-subunit alcohol dehydrogenase family)
MPLAEKRDRAVSAALVTGGARRIGRAIVEALAAEGRPVAIHCNNSREEANAIAARIIQGGGRATVIVGNLAELDGIEEMVAAAEAAIGPIGLLVNNASQFQNDSVSGLGATQLNSHLSTNLVAPCMLAAAVAKRLAPESTGLIINIIDQRVLRPTPMFFSYSLSKAGLWWATQTMAQALAPRIRVVAIGPGPTLRSARQEESDFHRQSEAVPLGHGPHLAEFGRTIRWLIETPSVTGQFIALDGGQHLSWQTPDVVGIQE